MLFTNLAERGVPQRPLPAYKLVYLHICALKITCTVQRAWLYKICPEEGMCKILYLPLGYFSPE